MSTLARRIVSAAEGEVGVIEAPIGSNRGARVSEYQAASALGGTGWPWCGAFVCWVWQAAGVEGKRARYIASPSVAVMCQRARDEGLVMNPRPGAALAWCGVHVEILHSPMGAGVWRTIGGNTDDGVRYRTRSVEGAVVFGPDGLEDAGAELVREPLYWLEDLRADVGTVGRWDRRAYAERALSRLKPDARARAAVVATPDGWWALRVGPPRHYGPWAGSAGKAGRDRARGALEARLGRRLRPYRTTRMPEVSQRAVEAFGKTT